MMRRNLRKAMSAVLVAAMTFGTPIAVNQNVTIVNAEETNADTSRPVYPENVVKEETLTGTAWWSGMQTGKDYDLNAGDGTTVLYVAASELNDDGYGAFNVELIDSGKYFTTGSAKDGWLAGSATGTVSDVPATGSELSKGHVYKITITRKNTDYTVNYYDVTTKKDYFEVTVTNSNLTENTTVHIMAQIGTYIVGKDVDPSATNFAIKAESTSDKSTENGTVYYSKLGTTAYYNDTVEIETEPAEGFSPYANIKCGEENVEYKIVEKDGKQFITFTMPKGDVTIEEIGFNGLDDAIDNATPIYETENKSDVASTKYTEDSFKTLEEAYEAALKVSKDEAATSKDKASAKTALENAVKSLVFKHDVKIDTEKAVLIGGKDITVTAEDKSEESKAGTWTSSNEDAATVENGVINAVADGTSTVTYTAADGTKASCKVTVIGTALLAGQSVNYSSAIADKDVTWSSSNEDVATVNEKGVVTAVANGETTITVSNGDTFEVTVSNTVANGKKAWADKVYSNAIEVTEDGAYLTFKSTTSSDEIKNGNLKYFTPVYKVTNADSKWVIRGADGWFSGDGLATGTSALVGGNSYSTLFTDTETSSDRKKWTTDNMNGINCYLSAKKDGNNIIVKWTMGDRTIQSTIPVNADEKSYISLSGELCDLSDIKVLTKEEYSAVEPVPFTPGSVADAAKTPGPEIDVPIDASEVVADETQSGTEWWTGKTTGKDYVLSGTDVTTELYVAADKLVNGYGAFSVEVYTNDRKFFTTGSDKNAWTAEQATGILSPFTAGVSELVEGHVYKITVTRKDKDITVKYYDATAQKDYFEVSLTDSNFNDEFMVHILYQVGTFSVGQTVNVDPNKTPAPTASTPSETTAPTAEPDNTVAPTTEPSAEPSADVTEAPTTAPSTEPSKTPAANTISKGDKATVSGAKYVATSSKEVSYTAAKKATASVVIPATVKVKGKTLKVTSIAAKAFKGNKTVKSLTVGKNVTTIGANAFNGCKKLKTLTIKSTKLSASKIAKNAFKGISKKTTVKVPKSKLKAYKKLLRKKGLAKSVSIKAL